MAHQVRVLVALAKNPFQLPQPCRVTHNHLKV